MIRVIKALLLAVSTIATFVALPATAAAEPVEDAVGSFTYSQNMHPLGYSARLVPLANATPGAGLFNSDLAFWGKTAYQGTYEGFRIVDVTEPDNPVQVLNYTGCSPGTSLGNQGDVIVWESILVRSWNSNTTNPAATCDGESVALGFEGLHVFDITDPLDPDLVASVDLPQGSHTATGVPDLENDRLLVYNSASSAANPGIDIVEVPFDDPASAAFLRFEPSGDPTVGGGLPNLVTIDAPSSAAGTYGAAGAAFGPLTTVEGLTGDIVLVNDGTALPTEGCNPLIGFPAGAIALVDRGTCSFVQKVNNAQTAGATGVIVANNVPGVPATMGGTDPGITIPAVQVSQADGVTIKAGLPASGTVKQNELATRSCHDTGVILGDALRVACAGGNGFSVWSLDDGGSLEDPAILYSKPIAGVSIGHSAAFTWDGEVLIFGHEPGGGGAAECQASSSVTNRTLFFFETDTGDPLGTFVHPRPQTATENCTWHNYNVVPTDNRYVLVAGNYQSGISVVDFSDPANASEIAFADPAPLVNPDNPAAIELGGDWSSYYYDGRIYESDITRGLIIWNLSGNATTGAKKLGHLNPQTQEFTL